MPSTITALQVYSISTSLVASGGIAALSLFDIPELRSQPASRSLPSIRWLFSRGSHIFPTAAFSASTGFACLAYSALPQTSLPFIELLKYGKVPGYLAAAVFSISLGPVTGLMIPTNFRLIGINEEMGGARSQKSANESSVGAGDRSADESVAGEGDVNQFTDLSGPRERTAQSPNDAENEEVQELLAKFGQLNALRAALLAASGIVGLFTALA